MLVAPRPRAAAGSSGASQADITRLTEELLEAEGRLAALFEPGKPMPRAGVVAAMRQEVAVMKERLATLMGGGGPAGAAARGAAEAVDDAELAERARQAFLEVERVLGARSGGVNARQRPDDSASIAVLEAENERLRVEATALLQRQQQLEELLDKTRGNSRN